MPVASGNHGRDGHDAIELQQFRDSSSNFRPRDRYHSGAAHDDNEEEEHDNDDDDSFDGLASDLRRKPSNDSTIQSFELYTPEEEKAVIRKLDRRVTLFMSFLYLLAFIDRSNIGNAKIAGLPQDLRLKGDEFEWLLTAFYITYILFEWMIMLYHILPPHIYVSICVLSWGLTAALQSTATSFTSLVMLRLILGVGEAAFSPGVPFYLSFFYKQEELALRVGMQVSAAPLAASFAGSLAWLITRLGENGPMASWRLLFLVEGFPSVIAAVFVWFHLPDSPGKASFLTERERSIAQHRLRKESVNKSSIHHHEGLKKIPLTSTRMKSIDWKSIVETLTDRKCYINAIMFLSLNIAFSSMPVFLPSVINEMGYSSISSQALSAPPFLVAFLVLIATAWASDRWRTRTSFMCLHAMLGFLGYSLIAIGGLRQWSNMTRYLCVYPATMGFFSAVTLLITLTINNQESNAKKGMGMTILNVVGQTGPLLGTRLYPDSDKPFYVRGMAVCAAAMLVVLCLTLYLRSILRRENEKRARTAVVDEEDRAELLASGETVGLGKDHFVLMI